MPPLPGRIAFSFITHRLSRHASINNIRPLSQLSRKIRSNGTFDNVNKLRTSLAAFTGLAVGAFGIFAFQSSVQAKLDPDVQKDDYLGDDLSEKSKEKSKSKRLKYNFIAQVVEQTAPAVVYIEVAISHPFSGIIGGVSGGSGFIVQPDGLILTNAHVVANSNTCTVTFTNGRKAKGIVEAVDEKADLATVRVVPYPDMPFIKLADSDDAKPGEFVIALGSPLSLTNSITSGIISSVRRDLRSVGLNSPIEYIQSDVAINQGNSGGPLVNLDGEAVGINSMKAGEGIAFAIPSNVAKMFLVKVEKAKQELAAKSGSSSGWFGGGSANKQSPRVPLPNKRYLGVTLLTLNPEIALELRMHHKEFPDVTQGAAIMKVVEGSPSHQAGLQPFDVIVALNGRRLRNIDELFELLESQDSLIVFDIKRKNQDLRITINFDPTPAA